MNIFLSHGGRKYNNFFKKNMNSIVLYCVVLAQFIIHVISKTAHSESMLRQHRLGQNHMITTNMRYLTIFTAQDTSISYGTIMW